MSVPLSDETIAAYWKELFDRNHYSFNNSPFSNGESGKKSVWISYSDIESIGEEFSDCLMSYPERTLSLRHDEETCIRITGLPGGSLKELNNVSSDDSSFISVKGIVTMIEPLDVRLNDGIKTILSETQRIVITDNPKGLRSIELQLCGDLLGAEIYGKTLIINGYYTDDVFTDDNGKTISSRHFEVNSIETIDNPFDITFTEEDIKEIRKASEDPLFFDNLVRSIAPTITGIDHIKMSLALQLFGGVKHIVDDGTVIPGNINILLLSDSDTVVSELIGAMSRLSPKSIILSGDDGDHLPFSGRLPHTDSEEVIPYFRLGAVTVANEGTVCVKDISRLDVKYAHSLNEVVNQLSNTVIHNNQVVRFPADVSLLCAATSKKELIGTYFPLGNCYGLRSGVISKFEPVFVLRDNPVEKDDASEEGDEKTTYDEEFIRKYVAYARLNCRPELPKELSRVIQDHCLSLGEKIDYIGPRQLETLVRLAEASARSRMSNVIDHCDITKSFEEFGEYLSNIMAVMQEFNPASDAVDLKEIDNE